MAFNYFSRNGELLPTEQASVSLQNIAYQYGFGVYESIRISNGVVFFADDHIERLLGSASIIGLQHSFTTDAIKKAITELLEKNAVETCNVKIVLIGGRNSQEAELNILCLNPLFPDAKLYRDGVHCITYEYERAFPHAKTLNMLQSYLAYTKAKLADAYDALLLDRVGNITEGTRTNFFCINDRTLYSPPEEKILLGVTRKHVLEVARQNNFTIEMRNIQWGDLPRRQAGISHYEGAFLTSTSSKIVPVHSIDSHVFAAPSEALKELMAAFNASLDAYADTLD